LLSERAVAAVARRMLGSAADDGMCAGLHRATGGNPFYLMELLRALRRADRPASARAVVDAVEDGLALRLAARLQNLDPRALRLAQAIAILGDDCELRHAAAIAQMEMAQATGMATKLVRLDVLGGDRPPRFIHPVVEHAVIRTLSGADHDAAHRAAARLPHADHSPPGHAAGPLARLRAAGEPWVVERLRGAARDALANGAPTAAADLLERALAEPPPTGVRVEVLREAARAQLQAGRALACQRLEEALA